ncbi:MAG: hypothetical protein ACU0CO_11145 [Shimia sp.]
MRPSAAIALVPLLAIGLGACTTMPGADGPAASHSATYAAFPGPLFQAAEAACSAPNDRFVRVSRTAIRCESLPSPTTAAALIVNYDGDIENLPRLVNRLEAQDEGSGIRVTADYFFDVPRKGGAVTRVVIAEPETDRTIRRVLALTGGEIS